MRNMGQESGRNENENENRYAALYCRVSTDEQAERGYSLADQERTLVEWAESLGHPVREIVRDDGYSGATPERPGLSRLLTLAESGGVSVVLVTARDRFFRDSFQRLVMDHTLADHGVSVRAMNDMEHRVGNTILDAFAEIEREEIARRLMNGKRQKAREGKVVAGRLPVFGFRFTEDRDYYEVHEPQMQAVRRAFELSAGGLSIYRVAQTLTDEGYHTHLGARKWQRPTVRQILLDDSYVPHTLEELSHHLSPRVTASLDPEKTYGIWWYGRRRTVKERGRKRTIAAPRSEWIAVPVPKDGFADSGVPREHVRLARENVASNQRNTRKTYRAWELSSGILRCGHCGCALTYAMTGSVDSRPSRREKRPYYFCSTPNKRGKDESRGGCAMGRYFSAKKIEKEVWAVVRNALLEPERLEVALSQLTDDEKPDDAHRIAATQTRLDELAVRRSRYIDLAADGIITKEDLAGKIDALTSEATKLKARKDDLLAERLRLDEVRERSRRTVEEMRRQAPEDLDALTGEERRHLYKTLDVRVHAMKTGPGKGAENTELRIEWMVGMVDSAPVISDNTEEDSCHVRGVTSTCDTPYVVHENPLPIGNSSPASPLAKYVITLRGGSSGSSRSEGYSVRDFRILSA